MNSINLLDENLLLWNQFRDGNADAFGEIMQLHYNDLFNYGLCFTKDEEVVKDCIQDLFLSLWKNRETINQTSFIKYYLLKSLRRRLAREIKKSNVFLADAEIFFKGLSFDLSPEIKIIIEEDLLHLTHNVHKVIKNLSKRQQEVIWLRYFMDADIDEISEIMVLNKQSVHNLLQKALKKLKSIYTKKGFSITDFYNYLHFF